MDLWIRSQDREYLEKIEKIYVWEAAPEDYRIEGSGELGTYKSKKRALEVLDEIQERVNFNIKLKVETCVYEMPEE